VAGVPLPVILRCGHGLRARRLVRDGLGGSVRPKPRLSPTAPNAGRRRRRLRLATDRASPTRRPAACWTLSATTPHTAASSRALGRETLAERQKSGICRDDRVSALQTTVGQRAPDGHSVVTTKSSSRCFRPLPRGAFVSYGFSEEFRPNRTPCSTLESSWQRRAQPASGNSPIRNSQMRHSAALWAQCVGRPFLLGTIVHA
jgi:hypothetical protein